MFSLFKGHVPQPFEFQLFFSALPLGIVLGCFWSRWEIGLFSLVVLQLYAGHWTSYHLGHFNELLVSDLNRLGQSLGGVYLGALVFFVVMNLVVHFIVKKTKGVSPDRT